MYLINTSSLTLEYLQNIIDVDYGILSHRWEHDEITHQEMRDGNASAKHGYQKVRKACEQARAEGLKYMWVDTCCIDKSSSAELTEAINSMYAWYQGARICYAYLADVNEIGPLEHSAWFTRGWTLQELIAPPEVDLYTSDWNKLGSRSSLCMELSQVTGIPTLALTGGAKLSHWTIAQRMSWAARRVTTRPEDRAYSLLGIFGINMALLYGEGSNAFVRLQKKIIKKTDDHSIFAWRSTGGKSSDAKVTSLLAESPDAFVSCSEVQRREPALQTSTYAMTNLGLSINLPLIQWSYDITVALLNCVDAGARPGNLHTIGIFLQRVEESDQYARITVNGQDRVFYQSACFQDDKIRFRHDQETVRAVLHQRTMEGPMIYGPEVSKPIYRPRLPVKKSSLYIRDDPLDTGRLKQKLYGFWFRRFTPYPHGAEFDPQKDFAIRTWHIWDWTKRRVWIPDGCFSDVCWIYIRNKTIVKAIDEPLDLDKEDSGMQSVPSMLLELGFSYDGDYNVKLALKDNPLEKGVDSIFSDPRSDAEFLSEIVSGKGGLMAVSYGGDFRRTGRISRDTDDRELLITTEVIDGVETKIVDLFWKGAGSRCDECGQIPVEWKFCCVSCESPHYDCCNDCFGRISETAHDAKPGNEKHRFYFLRIRRDTPGRVVWHSPASRPVESPRLL